MKKKTVLIGGAGFIGAALIKKILSSNRQITIVGRSQRPPFLPDNVTYIQSNCSKSDELHSILDGSSEIVDLSYTTTPKTSFENPILDIQQNLSRAVKLFEVARKLSMLEKLLVLSSGGTVYGKVDQIPITETALTTPISPYGITKLTIEKYALMYQDIYNLPIIIARPANVYGPRKKLDYSQGFIPIAFKKILCNEVIKVYGKKGGVRDYLYIDDAAEALITILNSDANTKGPSIFNIGTGIGSNNLDVLNIIQEIASKDGYEVQYENLPSRRFDVSTNILDSSLLEQKLGWKATTSLKDGLRYTWEKMKELNS